MTGTAPAIAVTRAVETVMRNDRGRLRAALIARLRDFQLAEDALQEAALSALTHWSRTGLPASPQGWLLKVALRKAIDRLRGQAREAQKAADLTLLAEEEAQETTPEMIPDERLRLIFTCCHPALESKSQVALTLRMIGGLTTPEIAAGFLDDAGTIGTRISRAKAKIAGAGIPFAVPEPEQWPERLQAVLSVIYLIFNAGYTEGATRDLCGEAIFLARLVDGLRPGEAETEGCLALLLLTHARRGARTSPDGATVPPGAQDRRLWDWAMMAEGVTLIARAMGRGQTGPFQIKAAIAALHGQPGGTDWPAIQRLYERLWDFEPTDVVRLNQAVALAEVGQMTQAVAVLQDLDDVLQDYQPFHAARAHVLGRAGRRDESLAAYDRAIAMAPSSADALFLIRKRQEAAH